MVPKDFAKWKQKNILGASIQVVAPTGQYYGSHLINPGSNRWAFKPELGYSRRWENWILDAYGGVWLFIANDNYLTGSEFSKRQNTLTQAPIGAIEMHLSYDVKPRLGPRWMAITGTAAKQPSMVCTNWAPFNRTLASAGRSRYLSPNTSL